MMDSVLVFLCLSDLNEGTVTEHVLFSIFATRIDVFDQLEFRGAYMRLCMAVIRVHMSYKAPLGPLERVFLACVYVSRPTTRLNWRDLSRVTHFTLQIQSVYNKYQEGPTPSRKNMYCALDAHERGVNERFDVLLFAESVIAEMFKPTVNPDCMDEIGRQKMFQLVPDTIT